jgi:hypothetical protein
VAHTWPVPACATSPFLDDWSQNSYVWLCGTSIDAASRSIASLSTCSQTFLTPRRCTTTLRTMMRQLQQAMKRGVRSPPCPGPVGLFRDQSSMDMQGLRDRALRTGRSLLVFSVEWNRIDNPKPWSNYPPPSSSRKPAAQGASGAKPARHQGF